MELNASVIIAACRAGAEEAARLAPFLDDLDGWDGADCDTGTNAAATMAALAAAMDARCYGAEAGRTSLRDRRLTGGSVAVLVVGLAACVAIVWFL